MVLVSLALLCFLIVILVKSSDYFVGAVARIAKSMGVSELVIGLTVVAIGTSFPELGSSVAASFAGVSEMGTGIVIGSNIANLALVLGLSAVLMSLKTDRRVLNDCSLMMAVSLLFWLFSLDMVISSIEALLLLAIAVFYLVHLFHYRPHLSEVLSTLGKWLAGQLNHGANGAHRTKVSTAKTKRKDSIIRDTLIAAVGLALIYLSAIMIIPVARDVAKSFGVPDNIIALTLLAVGTSLPELAVSISSIRKKLPNILLGNLIGSNIFNILLVAGAAGLVSPLKVLLVDVWLTLPFMLLTAAMLAVFIRTSWMVKRWEGVVYLAVYAAFIYLLLPTI